jgi:VanZ family protein
MTTNLLPSLQYKTLWLSLGWTLVIGVIIASQAPAPPLVTESLFSFLPYILPDGILHVDKIEHFTAYFVLMGWFAQIYHQPRIRIRYMIGFILLGIVMEILQGLGGMREADWRDALANTVGIWFAWQVTKTRLAYVLVKIEGYLGR